MQLPSIPFDANKYSRGSLLVLGGSARFSGAAVLAALAAARSGAGYVSLATPASVASVAQAHLLSIPVIAAREGSARDVASTSGVFDPDAFGEILAQLTHVDAIVCGPGLTDAPDALAFAAQVARSVSVPLLLDADALRIVGDKGSDKGTGSLSPAGKTPASDEGSPCAKRTVPLTRACAKRTVPLTRPSTHLPSAHLLADDGSAPLVLTPHAGELKRLLKAAGTEDVAELARLTDAIIVAKGPETRIVSSERSYLSASGTPALAKAGTGDVLAGVIGSLLAQGMEPFDAAVAGVELHSAAGRLAEQRYGTRSVMAEDVVEALSAALLAWESAT